MRQRLLRGILGSLSWVTDGENELTKFRIKYLQGGGMEEVYEEIQTSTERFKFLGFRKVLRTFLTFSVPFSSTSL